jgi:purine-binding chemotaxis protein CheW
MMSELSELREEVNEDLQQVEEQAEKIDFKMVTFSLAGKEYGIDIMAVKEISKAGKFTYVPNTVPFVRGVYNLRGEIISIIDLRLMFHLPVEERSELENIIILRLEDNIIGIIVDTIDKVVGISSDKIQPPHPLFGDINIRFIRGVVEDKGALYIILDSEKIFGQEASYNFVPETTATAVVKSHSSAEDIHFSFIEETLATFRNFFTTSVNDAWVHRRFEDWKQLKGKSSEALQLKSKEEADEFLFPFFSKNNGQFWEDPYMQAVESILDPISSGTVTVWNAGCGKGYETYSFACLLKNKYPGKHLRIWANDNDLLAVSNAPSILLNKGDVPASVHRFLTESRGGYQLSNEIKDAIMFEYHDVLHSNPFPPVDIILARDVLSLQKPEAQEILLAEFEEKLRDDGILIVGDNEIVPPSGWKQISSGTVKAFKKA